MATPAGEYQIAAALARLATVAEAFIPRVNRLLDRIEEKIKRDDEREKRYDARAAAEDAERAKQYGRCPVCTHVVATHGHAPGCTASNVASKP